MAKPDVAELADSIERHGQLHPIIVNKKTNQIICGRDRYSACYLKHGDKAVLRVEYLDNVSDLQAQQLECIENLHRRHDPKKQRDLLRALVGLYEQEAIEEGSSDTAKRRRGRPRTPRGIAIQKAAEAAGINPNTLSRDLRRDNDKPKDTQENKPQEPTKPPVETFGLEVDAGYLIQLQAIQSLLDQGYEELMVWRRRLNRLFQDGSPAVRLTSLVTLVQSVQQSMRRRKPASICPACKLIETLTEDCTSCIGSGYVDLEGLANTDPKLLNKDELMVMVGASIGEARYVRYDAMFEDEDTQEEIVEDTQADGPTVETLEDVQGRLTEDVSDDPGLLEIE